MSKKILAFGASSSRHSINKKFATWASGLVDDAEVTILDLNDFEMPIYSIDKEKENGIPELAKQFKKHIREADGIIISFAEHNSAYTAAYKNIYDWVSRYEADVWLNKPMLLLSTSPGGRGAKSVLEMAAARYSRSVEQVFKFSLPSFGSNFSLEEGILDPSLKEMFLEQLGNFSGSVKRSRIIAE